MKIIFIVTGLALIATGILWWRKDHPSAERPALLPVIVGIACVVASWWVP